MTHPPTDGERLSEIYQRAMRELVPTHNAATLDDIIQGQKKAMERVASEFVATYLARIADLETALGRIPLSDNERDVLIADMQRIVNEDALDVARARIAELESENKSLRVYGRSMVCCANCGVKRFADTQPKCPFGCEVEHDVSL